MQQVCGRLWSPLQMDEYMCGWQKLLVREHFGLFMCLFSMMFCTCKKREGINIMFVCCLQVLLCGTKLSYTRCLPPCCCHLVHLYSALPGPKQFTNRSAVWWWVISVFNFLRLYLCIYFVININYLYICLFFGMFVLYRRCSIMLCRSTRTEMATA